MTSQGSYLYTYYIRYTYVVRTYIICIVYIYMKIRLFVLDIQRKKKLMTCFPSLRGKTRNVYMDVTNICYSFRISKNRILFALYRLKLHNIYIYMFVSISQYMYEFILVVRKSINTIISCFYTFSHSKIKLYNLSFTSPIY